MAPSSKWNETKVASSTNVCIGEKKHIHLVTLINEIVIFHLHELLANVHGLPTTNEFEICQLKQQLLNSSFNEIFSVLLTWSL